MTDHPPDHPTANPQPPTRGPGPALLVPLVAHQLRFTVRVTGEIVFNDFKGSALRGALAGTMARTFCPEWRANQTDPLHQSLCPVCQLLSLENDEMTPGDVRRPYALRPPLDSQNAYAPGERFHFDLLLFGQESLRFLAYLALTVQGMGETSGVGRKDGQGRRGHFTVQQIEAVNPLTGEIQLLYHEEQRRLVHQPAIPITHEQVMAQAQALLPLLSLRQNRLTVHFHTPTRLIRQRQISRDPDFFALAKSSALRLLDMSAQHGQARPTAAGEPVQVSQAIYDPAETVTLVADQTRWWDLTGYSGRLKREQKLGGLVGSATYHSPDWSPLLPWLIWASVLGVGKNVVKGCGIISLT